jgi:hypothetical protein
MRNRRDATNHKTGVFAHEIGVRLTRCFARERSDFCGIDAIRTARDHKDRLTALRTFENHALGNLSDRATEHNCRLGRRAASLGMFANFCTASESNQCVLNPLSVEGESLSSASEIHQRILWVRRVVQKKGGRLQKCDRANPLTRCGAIGQSQLGRRDCARTGVRRARLPPSRRT